MQPFSVYNLFSSEGRDEISGEGMEGDRSWAEISVQEGMDLSAWGLPDLVLRQYYQQGIHKYALHSIYYDFMRRGSNRNTVGFKNRPFSTLEILIKRNWLRIEGCSFQSMKI